MASQEKAQEAREISYIAAITEGVRSVMLEQDNAFIAGEDVAVVGSVFGLYRGLLDEFGADPVVDTPISEEAIVGLGVGAAATGLRPIIDIMFMDFLAECMDEVANQLAKMRFMFGGNATLPVTIVTMGAPAAAWRRNTPRVSRHGSAIFRASRWSCRPHLTMRRDS